jgi:hypothetical protein
VKTSFLAMPVQSARSPTGEWYTVWIYPAGVADIHEKEFHSYESSFDYWSILFASIVNRIWYWIRRHKDFVVRVCKGHPSEPRRRGRAFIAEYFETKQQASERATLLVQGIQQGRVHDRP